MRKVNVFVELSYTKTIEVEVAGDESSEEKAREIVDGMTREGYVAFVKSCEYYVHVEELTIEAQVKRAIDCFDPYAVFPLDDGPEDEYDGESWRIAEEIDPHMSIDEIAGVIAREFTRSFTTEYTNEDCVSPAIAIYDSFLKHGRTSN